MAGTKVIDSIINNVYEMTVIQCGTCGFQFGVNKTHLQKRGVTKIVCPSCRVNIDLDSLPL